MLVRPDVVAISIHALREEGDQAGNGRSKRLFYFYPRPPRGGRRCNPCIDSPRLRFLSTPSARRATAGRASRPHRDSYFYPRPPRGGRPEERRRRPATLGFLSTPSARRATKVSCQAFGVAQHFYPRPPRGGRHLVVCLDLVDALISIHALREEGDHEDFNNGMPVTVFLSTPSARRATLSSSPTHRALPGISIHALREEGDAVVLHDELHAVIFLSTPSARRATAAVMIFFSLRIVFLSTPSARRATSERPLCIIILIYFYPRPPRGGRPPFRRGACCRRSISIHALREEGDR